MAAKVTLVGAGGKMRSPLLPLLFGAVPTGVKPGQKARWFMRPAFYGWMLGTRFPSVTQWRTANLFCPESPFRTSDEQNISMISSPDNGISWTDEIKTVCFRAGRRDGMPVPSIEDKIVVMGVFGANKIDYNAGLDAWAWTITLAKFRTVAIPIGPSDNRGVVYVKPPKVPKKRILAGDV